MSDFDVIVIGGGPGGYVAAIRAAQLGLRVACVEKRATLGGTCLNIGCIPSKALLQSSEHYAEAQHSLAQHGVKVEGVSLDLPTMMARKDQVVAANTGGVDYLFRKHKIERVLGSAAFTAPGTLAVTPADGAAPRELKAKSIVVATGSDSMPLAGVPVDEKTILSSTGALSLDAVPKHLVVVGGGYIGLEMGSVWARLGAEVTVVEFLDRIVPNMDSETGAALQKLLAKQGLKFKLGTKVASAKNGKGGVALSLEPARRSKPTPCWSRSADAPTPRVLAWSRPAWRSTIRAASSSIGISRPTFSASTPSAMSSPGRCWRTRRARKAWRSPKFSRASTAR
jgi:dihydrolipoamide dehydrogenase